MPKTTCNHNQHPEQPAPNMPWPPTMTNLSTAHKQPPPATNCTPWLTSQSHQHKQQWAPTTHPRNGEEHPTTPSYRNECSYWHMNNDNHPPMDTNIPPPHQWWSVLSHHPIHLPSIFPFPSFLFFLPHPYTHPCLPSPCQSFPFLPPPPPSLPSFCPLPYFLTPAFLPPFLPSCPFLPSSPLRNLMRAKWGTCDARDELMREHQNKHTHTHTQP